MNQETDPGSSEVKPGLIRAFLYPDPGPGYTRVRTRTQKYIPDRKRSQNLRAK